MPQRQVSITKKTAQVFEEIMGDCEEIMGKDLRETRNKDILRSSDEFTSPVGRAKARLRRFTPG